MSLRGLREKVLFVHNPLPAITDRALLDRAKIEFVDADDTPQLLSWVWRYDSGVNHEVLLVSPGEFHPLREKESRLFLDEFAEQGAVAVEDPEDLDEVVKAKLKGLKAARQFWLDRGVRRAGEYRKVHGIGKDELEERKGDLWPWYRNQEAAAVCDEEMKRLTSGGEVETPRAAKKRAAKK